MNDYCNADHIKNAAARALVLSIRRKYCGITKIYGSRYMTQLETICGYMGGATRTGYTLTIKNTTKEFKTTKEAGLFMEATINDLFDFGLMG